MRAILINPYTQTVSEVDTNGDINGETGFYELLGKADRLFSNMVECVRVGTNVDLWIDEEANLTDGRPVFELVDAMHMGGAALLLCNDGEGNCIGLPPQFTLDLVKSKVIWTELMTTGDFGETVEHDIVHPTFGPMREIIQGQPIHRKAAGYFVWCLEDTLRNDPEEFVLASSKHFTTRSDALVYAATIAPSRKAEVREAGAV